MFAKGKKKISPELLNSFRNHCLSIRNEISMRRSMGESTVTVKKLDSEIQVVTGDAMLLDKAIPREKFGK
jgi:hypothetical protein